MNDLVYIDQYGLKGSNFYWYKYEAKGLTKEDILSVGLTDNRVQVHKDLIEPLLRINNILREEDLCLYIKEGYRSRALYEIVYKKRVEKFGKEETDKLLNMKDMFHASGKAIDVALWDAKADKEIYLRNGEDGTDALFINYYKNKDDMQSKHYQRLQDKLINLMIDNGFRLGTKNEYFHFNYDPAAPRNY